MALDLTIAGTVVALSIVISGLLIGIGRAIGAVKLEYFGREELIQAIINAALVGAYATITITATEISKELVTGSACGGSDAMDNLKCVYSGISDQLYNILTQTVGISHIASYYQSIVLNFSTVTVQPLANLSSLSLILNTQAFIIQQLLLISETHIQLLAFFGPQLLTFFFPLGLLFRAFFSTRKLGGFLIAISIGLYLLYPSLVLVFPQPSFNDTEMFLDNVTNNTAYTTIPLVDLNDNYAVAGKLDNMTNISSGTDLTGSLILSAQKVNEATSASIIFIVLAPIFALIVTIVFIKEVTDIFGGEFFYAVGML